ncbi:DUF2306 domain-containing protein [Pyxidicoccus xibeiensis]|uniref:DUF2306 domain-containing protein n=1 Tax=Pyxidicoccus xibeiensis TaxID=2906759 RepID=UPI0020A73A50|nr:DUF2306 domain-containing protein [Pyxidicoccus xibeiensis]MCP3144986.1 DUF2306 domain-containing protein [Pyxidicoccus xibeiensis]
MLTAHSRIPAPSSRRGWLVPVLLLLAAVPAVAGSLRLVEVASGAEATPDNARFLAAPWPIGLHIVGATLFCVLGAFQFSADFRRRRPGWHRRAGRVLLPSGLVAAASGLWMNAFFALPAHDGALLGALRFLFGLGMLVALLLGLAAVMRRDFTRHGAWMLRGYAIGMGAGTQVLTLAPWQLLFGPPQELPRALLMGAAWVINLAAAEWLIRGGARS